MSKEELLANLREDIDLLTYDRQPTPEELKIVNDLSVIITIFNDQESLRDQIEKSINNQNEMLSRPMDENSKVAVRYSISILKDILKGT